MNDLLTTILKDTYTLAQLKHRLKILKTQFLETFFGGISLSESNSAQDLNWLKVLPSEIYQKFTKDNVYKIFEDLEKAVTKKQVLTIYLTFEPDDAAISQISTFARKNFGESLLLDTKLDPNLIAGAALSWKGVYRDYSLRAKIDQRKGEILESFKKFLR